MLELEKTFRRENIGEPIEASFEPAVNKTRVESYNADLLVTATKVYLLPRYPEDQARYNPICIEISEIAGCKKYGLFGFEFDLTDGSKQLFSNVGKKMREGITAAIEARKK
ncbi:MAG: phosphoenolpyruvate carboxylase [Bacteroidales bacterium]|jgi:hypothetical protein|nr:phosphoenolpyruvate carboxylase [Bacteroidales bacterium]